jgi:hypothetical protein
LFFRKPNVSRLEGASLSTACAWRRQWVALLFLSVLLLNLPSHLYSQNTPSIHVGWIMDAALEKSGEDATPLRLNDGNATFISQWVVLFEARIDRRLTVFSEIQTIRGLSFGMYALSAVFRVDSDGALQIEAGKFLAPFGNFLARRWSSENPLVDFPLLYNYRTAVSATEVPRTNSILLGARGRGYRLHYADVGALGKRAGSRQVQSKHLPRSDWGLRVVSRDVYLTGLQVFGSKGRLFYAVAITNGALSNPVDINNSNGMQVLGRIRFTPMMGLDLGTSFSTGPYLNKAALEGVLAEAGLQAEQFRQAVWSVDVSYSRGHAVLFAEAMMNRWETPFLGEDLNVRGAYLEAKYTLSPRLYVAGRWSRLRFSDIADPSDVDSDGHLREPWDYGVRQLELGAGYRINRNALLKAAYQFNRTLDMVDGDPSDDLLALQAVVFF